MVTIVTRIAKAILDRQSRTLGRRSRLEGDLPPNYLTNLRLAALLHDCGHGLFSRVSEDLYQHAPALAIERDDPILAHAKPSEVMSHAIITSRPFRAYIDDKVNAVYDEDIDIDVVADLVIGRAPPDHLFLAQLINGALDADKIDYMARDSYYSGVSTTVDFDRLVNDLRVFEYPDTSLRILTLSSSLPLERLLFSKVVLFSAVYHHQKTQAAESMVKGLFEYLRDSSSTLLGRTFEDDPFDFLRVSDWELVGASRDDIENQTAAKILGDLSTRNLPMRCLVLAKETIDNYATQSYVLNRLAQSPQQVRLLRKQIHQQLPRSVRANLPLHELWVVLPQQPSLREASQTMALLPGYSEPIGIDRIFPLEGWLRAFSDNKWRGYVFGPMEHQLAISRTATDVLMAMGLKLNRRSQRYAHVESRSTRWSGITGASTQMTEDRSLGIPSNFAPLQRLDVERLLNMMPGLREQANLRAADSPGLFADFEMVFILHFLSDLLAFAHAMSLCGLDYQRCHFLYKAYLYPLVDEIEGQLRGRKAKVAPLVEDVNLDTVLRSAIASSERGGRKIIVVEDGGYIVPRIHSPDYEDHLHCFRGAVEQTTKGIWATEEVGELRIPYLNVAQCDEKAENEPPLVANAIWENVRRLLFDFDFDLDLRRRPVLIVGFGTIGSKLAELLTALKYDVSVYDQSDDRREAAETLGYTVSRDMTQLFAPDLIVIAVTGTTSIGRSELREMRHNTVPVSASSDQLEIDFRALKAMAEPPIPAEHYQTGELCYERYRLFNQREIVLVAQGFPVNFWNRESLGPKLAQVAMIPLFLAASEVASNDGLSVGAADVETVNRLVADAGRLIF